MLVAMKVREIIKLVENEGWYLHRTKGSHRVFVSDVRPGIVVIPGHPGDDVPNGTLRAIMKQAGIEKK